MPPVLLLLSALPVDAEDRISRIGTLIKATTAHERQAAIARHGESILIVVTTGAAGLSAAEINALPGLKLVCSIGVGYEGIDIEHARSLGIAVSHGPGTNADAVADHAFALLLAAGRRVLGNHEAVVNGIARNDLPMPDQISGKKLGILGMGQVGTRIAKRASGFDMEVGYHALLKRDDVSHRFFASLLDLAKWCDVLVLAAPGGADTHKIVNAEIIEALGSSGYLINVARGSILDEQALLDALSKRRLCAAALDVYEAEPGIPFSLTEHRNVVLSPHIAGRSPKAMVNMVDLLIQNINRFLEGESLLTPIP